MPLSGSYRCAHRQTRTNEFLQHVLGDVAAAADNAPRDRKQPPRGQLVEPREGGFAAGGGLGQQEGKRVERTARGRRARIGERRRAAHPGHAPAKIEDFAHETQLLWTQYPPNRDLDARHPFAKARGLLSANDASSRLEPAENTLVVTRLRPPHLPVPESASSRFRQVRLPAGRLGEAGLSSARLQPRLEGHQADR